MEPMMKWGCCTALSLIALTARASTWTVTTTGKGGTCTANSTSDPTCTLDVAILDAGNGDTILFAPAVQTQTIFFQPHGNLTASVTIDGSPNGVVLDGAGTYNMFYIDGGPTVVLSHLTFQHGLGTSTAGAIFVSNGEVTIDSCTFAHNLAPGGGGAIFNNGSVTVLNSTFTDNHTTNPTTPYPGGAIWTQGPLVVANSTITGNTASGVGGGIAANPYTSVFLLSSIVASNSASVSGPDIASYLSTVTSIGSDLIGDNSGDPGYVGDPSDQIGVDPQFSPAGLADNGGATQTVAILSSSPAVRHGNCAGHVGDAASPTIPAAILDQRGVVRGAPCAIGAYDATVIFYGGFEN